MTRERRLTLAISILLFILVGGTVGFALIEDAGISDGLYMTVITISTVGFTEVFPLSDAGRVLTAGLIAAGMGAAVYTAGTVLEIGIERFTSGEAQRKRMTRAISQLDNHVILAGFGRVGSHTWNALRGEDVPVSVIELDPVASLAARDAGALVIEGDATLNEVLDAAGIARARALIACVRKDADNLVIVLSARNRRNDLPIISRASEVEARGKLRLAGADRVVSPQLVGAHRLAALAVEPRLDEFVDVVLHGKLMELRIEGFEVGDHSVLSGQEVGDTDLRSLSGAQLLALESPDGDIVFNPSPETAIRPGQTLIAIGTDEQIERLRTVTAGK